MPACPFAPHPGRHYPSLLMVGALLVLTGAATRAADLKGDPTKLEGKVLLPASLDDARLLGIIVRSRINQAQKGEGLSPDQATLAALIAKAFREKDSTKAYRYAIRFLILTRGEELTEGTELASSFDFTIDRRIVVPGETLRVALRPIFSLGQPLSGPYSAKLTLKTAAGEMVKTLAPIAIKKVAVVEAVLPTKDLKPGRYYLHYELLSPAGKSLVGCFREFFVNAEAAPRLAELKRQLGEIERTGAVNKGIRQRAAVETAAYIVRLFEQARTEYVAPMDKTASPMTVKLRGLDLTCYGSDPFNIEKDLRLARDLAADLMAGKDPLATRTGDMRLAYRSALDGTLQPFRIYVPSAFDPARKYPLIVALHGATGDENTYPDRYEDRKTGTNLFKKLGEERGYILATPNGRGPFGLYVDKSASDVMEVVERVRQIYPIASRQTFLTGHSMGGSGTWMLGFQHPDVFVALAPVAGRPPDPSAIAMDKAPDLPVLFSEGLKDTLVTPASARQLAQVARKQLKNFQYVEYPDDDHFVIGISSMPAIFDFFDAQRAGGKKPTK